MNSNSNPLVDLQSLSQLAPARRIDALLSCEDAARAVQELEPFALYHLVREVGIADCVDVCLLASNDQLQAFVDLDCWRRDEVDSQSVVRWLRVFLEASDARLHSLLRKLDAEPLLLLLQEYLLVFHLEDGQAPPELEALGPAWETLDGTWALVFVSDDDDANQLIRFLLRRWYQFDAGHVRIMFEAVRWELASQLTEAAFIQRQIRVAEMGFVPFDEAMGIYARRDLEALRRRAVSEAASGTARSTERSTHGALPDLFRERLDGETYLQRCIAAATDLPATLEGDIVNLANKALAAEPADPRDLEAVRQTFDKARSLLDIGLEYLSSGSVELGADIIETTHPQYILEAGYNVVLGVSDQARLIFGRHEVQTVLTLRDDTDFSLFGTADRGLVRGLLHPRPTYMGPDATYGRPFASLNEVGEAAARLALLAFEVTVLYSILGVSHDQIVTLAFDTEVHPPVELLTVQTLLRTSLALCALGAPETLRSISAQELASLAPFDASIFTDAGHRLLGSQTSLGDDSAQVTEIWIRRTSQKLEEELSGMSPAALSDGTITAEMLGSILLLQR